MQLRNYLKPWTKADLNFLKANYQVIGRQKCADALGRTLSSISAQVLLLGCAPKRNKWSSQDIQKLAELYPVMDTEEVARIIGKAIQKIHARASYMGLKKTKEFYETRTVKRASHKNDWTAEEIQILRDTYPNTPTNEVKINRSVVAIRNKAVKMGIKKTQRFIQKCRYRFGMMKRQGKL